MQAEEQIAVERAEQEALLDSYHSAREGRLERWWDRMRGAEGVAAVGVKTGGSRVGGPELCSRRMVTGDKGHDVFTQVRALLMEVKPYVLLD